MLWVASKSPYRRAEFVTIPPFIYFAWRYNEQTVNEYADRYKGHAWVGGTDLGFIPTTTNGRNGAGATVPAEVLSALSTMVPQFQSQIRQ